MRQQVLYFAEFIINALNKYSSQNIFFILQRFLLPSLQYEMNGKNYLHVFSQIFGLKIFRGNLIKDEQNHEMTSKNFMALILWGKWT